MTLPRRSLPALLGADVGQLLAAVPRVHDEQPGQRVEVALAGVVPQPAALAAVDDRHRLAGGHRAHAAEVHPEVPRGQALEVLGGSGRLVGGAHRVPHW